MRNPRWRLLLWERSAMSSSAGIPCIPSPERTPSLRKTSAAGITCPGTQDSGRGRRWKSDRLNPRVAAGPSTGRITAPSTAAKRDHDLSDCPRLCISPRPLRPNSSLPAPLTVYKTRCHWLLIEEEYRNTRETACSREDPVVFGAEDHEPGIVSGAPVSNPRTRSGIF
jgi:hypothetical protein